MEKRNLLDDTVYQETLTRIDSLTAETMPEWGTMTAAQMLAHCCEVQLVSNGEPLNNTPFIVKLIAPLIRKSVVNEKEYPHGTRTHPQYTITDDRDFITEKERFLNALDTFHSMDSSQLTKIEHALFGKMTRDEKGWSMYKHLDHHLRQFGV